MRKLIPICIFLAGAFLGKPIALGTVGLFAKTFLYFENGWSFSYGSVDWHEGKLIFREIDLSDPSFSLHAKRLSVFFGAKHLEVEQPQIAVRGMPRLQNGSDDWTLEMKDGTIAGDEFGKVSFSFEKTWRHHLGRLQVEKEGSRLEVEAARVENEIWVDADLHRFQTDALKSWIDVRGEADGRVHLVFDGGSCKRGSAHLDFRDAGYGPFLSGGLGTLDWEGEIGDDLFSKCLASMRMRLKVSKASVHGSRGGVEEVKGDFSFTAGVGARWEFEAKGAALGESFPISWKGRAFLHEARPYWAESEASCQRGRIALSGQEEMGRFRWKGKGEGIGPADVTLIQTLASLADPRFDAVELKGGTIGFEAELLDPSEWKLRLRGEQLACEVQRASLYASEASLDWTSEENGVFQFSGASAHAILGGGKRMSAEEWQGEGTVEEGALVRSHFEGKVDKFPGSLALAGTFGEFQLGAKGENFEAVLKCAWKERLDFVIEEGRLEGVAFNGAGWVAPEGFSVHLDRFAGPLSSLCRRVGLAQEMPVGRIESVGEGLIVEGDFQTADWFLQAKGELGSGLGFYCPIFEKKQERYAFDVRIETPLWDLVRLAGTASSGKCEFDSKRTHFLGMPAQIEAATIDENGLESLQMKVPVSWKPFLSAALIFFPEAGNWAFWPLDGTAEIDLAFSRKGGSTVKAVGRDLTWQGEPVCFRCDALEECGGWHLSVQADECQISARAQMEGGAVRLADGRASWKGGCDADFYGALNSSFQYEFHLPHLRLEIAKFHAMAASAGIPLYGLEGILEGEGMISHKVEGGHLEADFEVLASNLRAASLSWQNEGPIHFRYASNEGIWCSGLNLSGAGSTLPYLSCKIGLLQFDASRSHFLLHHAIFHLPPRILDHFPTLPPFFMKFNPDAGLSFTADLDCPSDFSSLSFTVKEVAVPTLGATIPLRNLSFSLKEKEIETHFETDHQGYPVKVSALCSMEEVVSGRLTLEDGDVSLEAGERPLSIDWSYSAPSGFALREIEGRFGGMEASFHALDAGSTLVGSAKIDFGTLSKIIPPRIAQVFTDLNMGKGYELKGKLFLEPCVSFSGLFTGKQFDLFGYQLRTLLSQFEFSLEKVRLYDLKISDSAGIMKIDELIAAANGDAPWTLSIPHLTILELRPSLLQGPNRKAQPAGPLVVRELKIDDFKGLLEESKTYTAKGSLTFINSFRREHTLFDIPSDVLGRIVGLDLELLIPACGALDYELKDGLFILTSLYDSFSEARRSEFFLVPDPAPTMDLDGNLHILVSMKQFVLFKLTESFQILIDGKLDDPQFHLQKKRRFLGL